MKFLLAIDLETTGLDPDYNEITQIGVLLLDNQLNHIAHFDSLVRIDYPERGEREDFNVWEHVDIDPADLETAPTLEQNINRLLSFVKRNTGLANGELKEVTVMGQNTKFDFHFLDAGFRKVGKKWPFDYHNIDLVSLYTAYHLLKFGKLPEKVGLKYVCEHFKVDQLPAHNAMNDITMTVAMFTHILKELGNGLQ